MLFLGLELMSLPVYVLVLLAYRRPQSAEAALKYLVLGGTATATFLMGASLLYGSGGSLGIDAFARALGASDGLSRAAVVLIVLAFFLKGAIVPFHAWAPDAYEGASVPVTAYMATIVKAGVLLAVVRLFGRAQLATPMLEIFAVLPLVSIVWGNLAAMRQPSLRRMIAYSSIAHAGYLFYALLGDAAGRLQAVAFYLLAYGLMNLLAFAALPAAEDDVERDRLDNLKGLFHRAPYAAADARHRHAVARRHSAVPGLRRQVPDLQERHGGGLTTYAVLGLVGSYLGIYFYLRLIQFMFMSPDAQISGAAPRRATRGRRKRGVPRRRRADRRLSGLGDRRVLKTTPVLPAPYRHLREELSAFLPSERLVVDPLRLLAWGTDASFYRLVPKLLVVVDDESELRRVLAGCARLERR